MTTNATLYVPDYAKLFAQQRISGPVFLRDHLLGFDQHMRNRCLDHLAIIVKEPTEVWWHVILDTRIRQHYPLLRFRACDSSAKMWYRDIGGYRHQPRNIRFANYLSCLNGSAQIGRQFLVSALHKRGMFYPGYCSKNFCIDPAVIDAHICDYAASTSRENFYLKTFSFDPEFLHTKVGFGYPQHRYDHANNVASLEPLLTGSFLNLVSEGYSTSYYPFFTEKFLYAVATQSLFLAWAQPQWHWQLSEVFGFRLYNKIFCYDFDYEVNPLDRLMVLLDMVGRYQNFSVHDWHDLYLLQRDEIQFNYQHMISGDFLRCFERYA